MRQSIEEEMETDLIQKANLWFTTPGKFYDPRPPAIRDFEMEQFKDHTNCLAFKHKVEGFVRDLSNDMELGAAIRQYVSN